MIAHWIWLAGRPGLGPVNQRIVLELFGSAEAVYAAGRDALLRAGLSAAAADSLSDKELGPAESVACRCAETGIRVLTLADEDYPAPLRAVSDAPTVLYLKGRLPAMGSAPVIGLVGSRDADSRGLSMARQLGWQIAGCGGIVVTGMARGIDAWSAHGALDCGGAVIGVLGCGVDVVYPAENRALYRDVAANGCLISEFEPGTPPNGQNFPVRNRIISGLCNGVLVVEAGKRSGALITANRALEQGRDVFAIPSNLGVDVGEGTNQLLRDGAILVMDAWDVLKEYAAQYPVLRRPGKTDLELMPRDLERSAETKPEPAKNSKTPVDKPEKAAYIDLESLRGTLSEDEWAIAQRLSDKPVHVDTLIEDSGLAASQALAALTLLELKQIAARLPGRRYTLAQK